MTLVNRIPWATISLVLVLLGVYASYSQGTLYLPEETVRSLALKAAEFPQSALTHLFIHVGVEHLVGNLLPLLFFGVLFELAVGTLDALIVFFAAGILASTLFVLFNPGAFLVGASAGVSGLIGAAFATKPRATTIALIFLPLFLVFVAHPALASISTSQAFELQAKQQQLQQNVTQLIKENKTAEAAQVSQTLVAVSEQNRITQTGRSREASTGSDLSVHIYGAIIGILYVFLARREKLDNARKEIVETGDAIKDWLGAHGKN